MLELLLKHVLLSVRCALSPNVLEIISDTS